MAATLRRTHLTQEATMRSILSKMEREPDYRPRWLGTGREALSRGRECLEDVKELLRHHRTEGEA